MHPNLDRLSPGRARAGIVALLGALALLAIVALCVILAMRKSEVEQLVDILCGPSAPDAAWAFTKLLDVEEEILDRYASSDRATPLHVLSHAVERGGTNCGWNERPLLLGAIVRFAREVGAQDRTASAESGSRTTPFFSALCARLFPETVKPPSRMPGLARLARDGDGAGLLEILSGESKAEAACAFQVLSALPGERLEAQIPFAASVRPSRIVRLARESSTMSTRGCPVGQVVRFLFWTRVAKKEPGRWTAEPPPPDAVEKLAAAWKEYLAAKPSR